MPESRPTSFADSKRKSLRIERIVGQIAMQIEDEQVISKEW